MTRRTLLKLAAAFAAPVKTLFAGRAFVGKADPWDECRPISPEDVEQAKEHIWIGGSSDWNHPNNWYPYGKPGNGDSVVIPPGSRITEGLDQSDISLNVLEVGKGARIGRSHTTIELQTKGIKQVEWGGQRGLPWRLRRERSEA